MSIKEYFSTHFGKEQKNTPGYVLSTDQSIALIDLIGGKHDFRSAGTKECLLHLRETVRDNNFTLPIDAPLDALIEFSRESGHTEGCEELMSLKKIASINTVGRDDLSNEKNFDALPQIVKYSLSNLGKGMYKKARQFVDAGGVMMQLTFNKPTPEYKEEIEKTEGNTMTEKVIVAVHKPTPELIHAGHEFISVSWYPENKEEYNGTASQLTDVVNRRIDNNIEDDYARLVLMKTLMREEMKSSIYAMSATAATIPLLHFINEHFQDNALAQTLIKFIPPFVADLVTFWSQLNPWLDGDSTTSKLKDFGHKLITSHKTSFATSIGATILGSAGAEYVGREYGDVAGAYLYSGIPAVVAGITTIDTVKSLQKKMGTSFGETTKIMFANNPAHVGVDIGAALTFATGVGVLGYGGQLGNPTALALIEGAEEHTFAALYTLLQDTIGQSMYFNARIDREIASWKQRVFSAAQTSPQS